MPTHLERRVRSNDPETSWIAAAGMPDEQISELQAWILVTLREKPLAHHELEKEHGAAVFARQIRSATPQRIRTACRELQLRRLVVEVEGVKRKTPFGFPAQVWTVAT
jgi:hypothetical protein